MSSLSILFLISHCIILSPIIFVLTFFCTFDRLTALRPIGYRDELRRFRPGLDYTVAHHGAMTVTARLDATLCFVDDDRITLEDDEEVEDINDKRKDKKGLLFCSSFSTSPSFIVCNM